MAPTEASILTNFLLTPAPLNAAISKDDFAAYFPRSVQSSEDVDFLYEMLSRQLAEGIEEVKANISAEVQRGVKQQRQIVQARRKLHQSEIDAFDLQDIQMTEAMREGEQEHRDLALSEPHTERTIVPAIEAACREIEDQISALEQKTADVLEDMKETIGNLSDLRYGNLPKVAGSDNSIAEETVAALRRLQDVVQTAQSKTRPD